MLKLLVVLALALSVAGASSTFRWPFKPSPFVVENNTKDGLPDFTYFDAINASLTPTTIACPTAMQRSCSTTKEKVKDKGCGADGKHECYGALYCDISHRDMKHNNLTSKFFPNYVGKAGGKKNPVKAVPRTRRNILQRAIGWLAVHAPYIGGKVPNIKYDGMEMCASDDVPECPQRTYTLTCEGLISMAYGTPGYGGGKLDKIHYSALQPGDAIPEVKYKDGKRKGTNHFLMFREWIVVNKTVRVYQMGGNHNAVNMVVSDKNVTWCDDKIPRTGYCHGAGKYANLIEEGAAAVALA